MVNPGLALYSSYNVLLFECPRLRRVPDFRLLKVLFWPNLQVWLHRPPGLVWLSWSFVDGGWTSCSCTAQWMAHTVPFRALSHGEKATLSEKAKILECPNKITIKHLVRASFQRGKRGFARRPIHYIHHPSTQPLGPICLQRTHPSMLQSTPLCRPKGDIPLLQECFGWPPLPPRSMEVDNPEKSSNVPPSILPIPSFLDRGDGWVRRPRSASTRSLHRP